MTPGILVVLDGWGHVAPSAGNAIALAATPSIERLQRSHPWMLLEAAGTAVGLPAGTVGNSEIGHLTLGAGRVIEYESTRIERAARSGELRTHPLLRSMLAGLRERGGALHLIGLCSDGMVHGHLNHFGILLDVARVAGVETVFLHAFSDGRDVPDGSAAGYLAQLEGIARRAGVGRIATVVGRAYAMDKAADWSKTAAAYHALVAGQGDAVRTPVEAAERARAAGMPDENISPAVLVDEAGRPVGPIRDGDAVVFVNFRGDRLKQLVCLLADPICEPFPRQAGPRVELATLTDYFLVPPVPALFPQSDASDGLANLLEQHGVGNLRIAETEKFSHVTFFLNGRDTRQRQGEEHVHVPSRTGVDYRQVPEMSAWAVAQEVAGAAGRADIGLVVANLANADVLGHTGDLNATRRAVEVVDACVGAIALAADAAGRWLAIVGDHGNAETMLNPDTGAPYVAHTTNPVPFILVQPASRSRLRPDGSLADVAPTVAALLGLEPHPRMSRRNLVVPSLVEAAAGSGR